MFEKTKDNFYQSLGKSIQNRKKMLNLKRTDILSEPTRVSKIVKGIHNKHYPYLICPSEYPCLNYLFLCKDHDSFVKNNSEIPTTDGDNDYDEMFWGHINWDKMFKCMIDELSKFKVDKKLAKSEMEQKLAKLFEDTLVDYAPYAIIRYDELSSGYGTIWIPQDERDKKRENAIERVHLGQGSELFKRTFLERFSGKTLREFDKKFPEFVSDYLKKRRPGEYSIGSQVYNFHINLSIFVAKWQSLNVVQYGYSESDKEESLEKLLRKYINNGQKYMKGLEKYQKKFDDLKIDINSVCDNEEKPSLPLPAAVDNQAVKKNQK